MELNAFFPAEVTGISGGHRGYISIYACDKGYFFRFIKYLIGSRPAWANKITPFVFVLSQGEDSESFDNLRKIAVDSGIIVCRFRMPRIIYDQMENLAPGEARFARFVQINWLRCARFCLAKKVFEVNSEHSGLLVADFDTIIMPGFPEKLFSMLDEPGFFLTRDWAYSARAAGTSRFSFGIPHRSIKAGFSVFDSSAASLLFLRLVEFYSLASRDEHAILVPFCFYFGDQLAMHYAVSHFQALSQQHCSLVKWLDYRHSGMIGISPESPNYFFYPKGASAEGMLSSVFEKVFSPTVRG